MQWGNFGCVVGGLIQRTKLMCCDFKYTTAVIVLLPFFFPRRFVNFLCKGASCFCLILQLSESNVLTVEVCLPVIELQPKAWSFPLLAEWKEPIEWLYWLAGPFLLTVCFHGGFCLASSFVRSRIGDLSWSALPVLPALFQRTFSLLSL